MSGHGRAAARSAPAPLPGTLRRQLSAVCVAPRLINSQPRCLCGAGGADDGEFGGELLPYITGEKQAPLPTYFIGGWGSGSKQALEALSGAGAGAQQRSRVRVLVGCLDLCAPASREPARRSLCVCRVDWLASGSEQAPEARPAGAAARMHSSGGIRGGAKPPTVFLAS